MERRDWRCKRYGRKIHRSRTDEQKWLRIYIYIIYSLLILSLTGRPRFLDRSKQASRAELSAQMALLRVPKSVLAALEAPNGASVQRNATLEARNTASVQRHAMPWRLETLHLCSEMLLPSPLDVAVVAVGRRIAAVVAVCHLFMDKHTLCKRFHSILYIIIMCGQANYSTDQQGLLSSK